MRKIFKLIVSFLTFGMIGDFFFLRKFVVRFPIFRYLYYNYLKMHSADIPLTAQFKGPVLFPHGIYGCFFSINCEIGSGCTIFHHVTIGSNFEKKFSEPEKWGSPKIGNNVFIGAGAKIIGPVTIGDGAKIGAGCIVFQDIPAGATCVMQKPRLLKIPNE